MGEKTSPSQARPAAAGRPKKTPEKLERERDAVIMSRLSIDQAIEYEALCEDIATEKQTVWLILTPHMHTLTCRVLAKPDAESKVWYCAGDFFIHLPKQKAEGLVQRGTCRSSHAETKQPRTMASLLFVQHTRPRQRSVRG